MWKSALLSLQVSVDKLIYIGLELENIIEAVPEGKESSISRTQVTYKRLRNIGTDEVSLYPSAKRNRRGEPQRSLRYDAHMLRM